MPDFDANSPYNDLPLLPPTETLIESTEILKKCIKARVALAELKQAAELIPNSAVLVNALPLLEARASSEIENIVTTTDKLFEFVDMAEDKADAATKEALRYRAALIEGTSSCRVPSSFGRSMASPRRYLESSSTTAIMTFSSSPRVKSMDAS